MLLLLARRGLVTRSERVYKKPKPGKKRLTKWPRKLQAAPAAEQVGALLACCGQAVQVQAGALQWKLCLACACSG